MILAQDMADRMRSGLDAEGADHYNDTRDIIPAINGSVDWLVNVINSALGDKKFSEEIFCDLTQADVFRTTEDSRISLNVFPDVVWTILAIYPQPVTKSNGNPVIIQADMKESVHLSDLYHISSDNDAKRLTIEEWSANKGNPFEAGYDGDQICEGLKKFAYLAPYEYEPYAANSLPNNPLKEKEIELRPALANDIATVFYVKRPTPITALTDNIEFPPSVFPILYARALQYVSWKQGDQTNLFAVTTSDISTLVQTII